jgi:predicted aconitase with swiveling domain
LSADSFRLEARVLISGSADGNALCLEETLSFWGGFDPIKGEIIDVHHPQFGQRVAGSILFIPESRGSAGTPGGIAETLRNGSGPAALVLGKADVNIGVGALVANRLYGLNVPVLELSPEDLRRVESGDRISIEDNGVLLVSRQGL